MAYWRLKLQSAERCCARDPQAKAEVGIVWLGGSLIPIFEVPIFEHLLFMIAPNLGLYGLENFSYVSLE